MSAHFANLLVFGFIHEFEKNTRTIMIPTEIFGAIFSFYPILSRFELYDSELFELVDDGYGIRGSGDRNCSGYMIFLELLFPDGYNKGIHYLSIKLIGKDGITGYCYHNIGVLTERNPELLSMFTAFWPENTAMSGSNSSCLLEGGSGFNTGQYDYDVIWPKDTVITIKLDCDNGTIEYYQNDKFYRKDVIAKDLSYHFALNSCAMTDNYFQIVETDTSIFDKSQ